MSLKEKINSTFKDMLGVGVSEEDERYFDSNDEVVDDINDVGRSIITELKTEFIAKNEGASVQDPIGVTGFDLEEENITTEINGNQTVFVEPKNYKECKKIANYIKENKTVTVNLENVEGGIAQRILDFISGASTIKGASFIPVSKRVYVVVPQNVEIVFEGKTNELGSQSIQLED